MFVNIATFILLVINILLVYEFTEDVKPFGCIILGLCYVSFGMLTPFSAHPILLQIGLLSILSVAYEHLEHIEDIDENDDNTPKPS